MKKSIDKNSLEYFMGGMTQKEFEERCPDWPKKTPFKFNLIKRSGEKFNITTSHIRRILRDGYSQHVEEKEK